MRWLGFREGGFDLVVSEEAVGDHIEGGGDAEVFVKAFLVGAVRVGGVEVDLALFVAGPFEAEVPFSDAGGFVAVALEDAGDGGAIVFDEGFVLGREEDAAF